MIDTEVAFKRLPYNAGQSIEVKQVFHAPVTDVDWGTITVTENWGRLFIKKGSTEIVVDQVAYIDLRNAIYHFIGPNRAQADAAQIDKFDPKIMWGDLRELKESYEPEPVPAPEPIVWTKKLKWSQSSPTRWDATGPFWDYRIYFQSNKFVAWESDEPPFDTLEEAMQCHQTGLDQRILEWINSEH